MTKKLTKKEQLWVKCCKAGIVSGGVDTAFSNAKAYTIKELEDFLVQKEIESAKNELSATANKTDKENKEEVKMAKNTVSKGDSLMMNINGNVGKYTVTKVTGKMCYVIDEEGNEKSFALAFVNASLKKQAALILAFKDADTMDDDEDVDDLDDSEDESEDDEDFDDEDEEDDLDEIEDDSDEDDEEEDDEPAPTPKKPSKPNKKDVKTDKPSKKESKPKKDKKSEQPKVDKYWENEDPYLATMERNEVRFYEDAGKFQLFSKYEKDGEMHVGKGVTVDVASITEKDAMKLLSNLVFALDDKVEDDRFNEALELLESINKETNPEDYNFDKKELRAMTLETIVKIAKNLSINTSTKKRSTDKFKDDLIKEIIKVQSELDRTF